MKAELEEHPETLVLWPAVAVQRGWCEACQAHEGWGVQVSWLVWSVSVVSWGKH